MRVLVAHPGPNFSVADVCNGWIEGLEQVGARVSVFNLDERLTFYSAACLERDGQYGKAFSEAQAYQLAQNGLLSACYQFWPDVLLVISGFFIATQMLDLIRSRGTKVVMVHTESPYQDGTQLARAPHVDLNLINDPTNLTEFTALTPTVYQPHCYRPSVHRKLEVPAKVRSDFAFVGTGYESRIRFLEQVDFDGVDVALAGNWQALSDGSPLRAHLAHAADECCDNTETVRLYSGTAMSANLYRVEAESPDLSQGWAMGPREVELAAMGVFFLRDPRGEGDELLPSLPTFTSPDEFTDQLRWWLAHPVQRERAARAAQAAVVDRTFANAAAALLQRLAA